MSLFELSFTLLGQCLLILLIISILFPVMEFLIIFISTITKAIIDRIQIRQYTEQLNDIHETQTSSM